MAFQGPKNQKTTSSSGVLIDDAIGGLVIAGVSTSSWALGEVKRLIQISDAEDLGIDAAYDSNNGVRAYSAIESYFRYHAEGTLYVMLTATGQTIAEIGDTDGGPYKSLCEFEEAAGAETAKPGIKFYGILANRAQTGSIWKSGISAAGTNYVVGDLITATDGDGTGFQAKVTTIDGSGGVTGIEITVRGTGYTTLPTAFSTNSAAGAGCVLSPAFYVPVYSDGVSNTLVADGAEVQATIDAFSALSIYTDVVFIETLMEPGTSLSSVLDLTTNDTPQVGYVAAADPAVVDLNTALKGTADIGSALGMLSARDVAENLGSVDIINKPDALKGTTTYSLTRVADNRWLAAELTNGDDIKSVSMTTQESLDEKGYIFVGKYEGMAGKYFNADPTGKSTLDHFSTIRSNRSWNKCARIVRQTLLPKMKSKILKDADGNIVQSTVEHWQDLVNQNLFNLMIATEQVSAAEYRLSPTTTVSNGKTRITGTLKVIRVDSADEIVSHISFVNSLN